MKLVCACSDDTSYLLHGNFYGKTTRSPVKLGISLVHERRDLSIATATQEDIVSSKPFPLADIKFCISLDVESAG